LCVGWLGDDFSSIRKAAATNLRDLTELFGTSWAAQYLFPSISEMRRHSSYLRRLTAVQACALMATKMEPENATVELLPMVLELSTDPVANIRFNVAKCLEQMGPVCGQPVYESQIRPVLNVLLEDPDRDVRFFAEHTFRVLEEAFGSE
jgi:serine/threonine-protein phosphatase 2A regulatory subunit A